MLTIYGMNLSGPALKVFYVANALGLEYEQKGINLGEGEGQKEDYLKMHPAGKIPVIDDDGFYLFESNAIIRYLAQKENSSLYPTDLKKRVVVDQWIDFASLHIPH